jgi:hypothetical protein
MKGNGRPPKLRSKCFCAARAEGIISDITFFVDMVMSWLYSLPVLRGGHIEEAMRSRLEHEIERMGAINARMKELAMAYNEFLDLREEARTRKERLERLIGLLGQADEQPHLPRVAQFYSGLTPDELRSKLPLWEAMKEYLSFVPEARIGEMEEFFAAVGFTEGNRQAMESALKRHASIFKIRKRKREKHISLKGA